MDFTSLAIAPVAAVVTASALILALITKRYREPRSLLVAFLAALLTNAVLFEPWYYVGWEPLFAEYGLLSTLGFCIGSFAVLVPAKMIAALRRRSR